MTEFILRSPQSPEEFDKYFHFRWQHLRQPLNLPLGSEQDEDEQKSFHCMAIMPDKKIIGVGRINADSSDSMRIRYMAVDQSVQGTGVGSAILRKLIEHAKEQHTKRCWLKAREQACDFYLKQGFAIQGGIESQLPVPHFLMEKVL